MSELPKNLIDLGQYPKNDVELIAREFLRCVYLDTLDTYIKDFDKLDEDDEGRRNIIRIMQSFEHTIAVLDQSEDFLLAIHADPEEESKDEFDRF
tara:strand:+ start:155 stop:439 length:285 start_codon:yes stop_codon:yes gene_type:complete